MTSSTDITTTTSYGSKYEDLKCWPQIRDQLRAGVSCESIAEFIQVNQGECQGVKFQSVVRGLHRLKSKMPMSEVGYAEPTWLQEKVAKMARVIDEGRELEKLYLLQLSRIGIAGEFEAKLRIPSKTLGPEIALAQSLLRDMASLKFKLGIYAAPTHGEEAETSAATIAKLPPDQRAKFGSIAKALLDTLATARTASDETEVEAEIVSE